MEKGHSFPGQPKREDKGKVGKKNKDRSSSSSEGRRRGVGN